MFSVMNYLLPFKSIFPMHCSANIGRDGKTALFFGLSGTGKTTLSADPERRLIGDDEHGWSNNGIFNFEGGCYAKCINLQRSMEPQIWNAIKFGSVMENVILDQNREPDFGDESLTENTRVAYPIEFIPNTVLPSVGNHPDVIIFLAADAFGVSLRLEDCQENRLCITSCQVTLANWLAQRGASLNHRRHFLIVLAHLS